MIHSNVNGFDEINCISAIDKKKAIVYDGFLNSGDNFSLPKLNYQVVDYKGIIPMIKTKVNGKDQINVLDDSFVKISHEIMFNNELHSTEKLIMCIIYSSCDNQKFCWHNKDIAALLNLSTKQIKRSLSNLRLLGYIKIEGNSQSRVIALNNIKSKQFTKLSLNVLKDNKLDSTQLLIYTYLTYISGKKRNCDKSNLYFQEKFCLSKESIQKILNKLQECSYIERFYNGTERIIKIINKELDVNNLPSSPDIYEKIRKIKIS